MEDNNSSVFSNQSEPVWDPLSEPHHCASQ